MDIDEKLNFLRSRKDPAVRAALAGALWLRSHGADDPDADELIDFLVEPILEEAWSDPDSRRMTLFMLRATSGWERRELAKLLQVSIVDYNRIELGRRPLSRESLNKVVAAKEVPGQRVEEVLLTMHAMTLKTRRAPEPAGSSSREPSPSTAPRPTTPP